MDDVFKVHWKVASVAVSYIEIKLPGIMFNIEWVYWLLMVIRENQSIVFGYATGKIAILVLFYGLLLWGYL